MDELSIRGMMTGDGIDAHIRAAAGEPGSKSLVLRAVDRVMEDIEQSIARTAMEELGIELKPTMDDLAPLEREVNRLIRRMAGRELV